MEGKIKYILYLASMLLNKKKFYKSIKSQNDNMESKFLMSFIEKIDNKSFIEFGFHPFEFNTIHLMTSKYSGTLVDCNKKNIFFMKLINLFHNYKLNIIDKFLNKENIIDIVKKDYGILSMDIDGNDYWLLKEILNKKNNFELIIVEYNPSFLDKFITVPYDPVFSRHQKHYSGWYHGASLNAFIKLLNQKNYVLIKTTGGNNAFFVKKNSLNKFKFSELTFEEAFEESVLRNFFSKKNAQQQYDEIKNLEYVEV